MNLHNLRLQVFSPKKETNMKKTRILSVILALLLVICAVPFSAFAAGPEVLVIDGERVALVNSFGKMNYEGKAYQTFKTFDEAFNAIGKDGGTIIFTGNINLPNFKDIKGRNPITLKGMGTKVTGNLLNLSGSADAPTMEIVLEGDLILDFVMLRTAPGAYIYTNGFSFETINESDTYYVEHYGVPESERFEYRDSPSVAIGELASGAAVIELNEGSFETLAAGSVNGKSINGNTFVSLGGGKVGTVVGANATDGVMNGNATLTIGEGEISKLVAGSSAGTVNGNVTVKIGGGTIAEAVIGAEAGATINGNIVVALNGGTFGGTINAGAGTVTGKKIVITGAQTVATLGAGAADVIVKITGGLCEPVFEGSTLKGYRFTDSYGIPLSTATINGQVVTAADYLFQLSDGENTVSVETKVNVGLNANANYVAGYEDGTFLPQNNMTRAEAVTLLTRLITDENNIKGFVESNYTDVPDGAWYEPYVGFFEKLGILDSVAERGGTIFKPTQNITRAEFAELIYKVATLDAQNASSSVKLGDITDVKSSYKYAPAIYYAIANGIVTGYEDNTFRPENNITRAEVVTMVNRFLGRTPTGVAGAVSFSDTASHWANGQILAACNPEGVAWTKAVKGAGFTLPGTDTPTNVKALYEASATLNGEQIREGVDMIAEQMKKTILSTPNTEEIYGAEMTGQKYYISEKSGNDENDGKTPETAWKTAAGISKNIRFPKKGTSILFERGGVYRGQVPTINGVIYGSYGEGEKPVLMQSKKNYADEALWQETQWENVYLCADKLINVGVIGFDHDIYDFSEEAYNETYGIIMNPNTYGVTGPESLNGDLQFLSLLPNGDTTTAAELYLYCEGGNPGKRFKSIEIGERINIFGGSPNGFTLDNISMKFGGGHGIGFGTCRDVRVTNCIFSWIGGSVLSSNNNSWVTNYGNAVEIYGGCSGYHVENNWMYQIYDTGVTHQRSSSTGDCIQENVNYLSNLIEYVFWGIEFYNAPPTAAQLNGQKDTYTRITRNVTSAYNLLRFGGYGWGSIVRYRSSQLYCGSTLSTNENCKSEYNIFDRATGYLLNLPSNSNEVCDKNIYIQTVGYPLGNLKGVTATAGYESLKSINTRWGDKNAVVIVIDPAIEPVVLNKPEGLA